MRPQGSAAGVGFKSWILWVYIAVDAIKNLAKLCSNKGVDANSLLDPPRLIIAHKYSQDSHILESNTDTEMVLVELEAIQSTRHPCLLRLAWRKNIFVHPWSLL